jgi:4-hydroxybenzoate polyprenyltransferase
MFPPAVYVPYGAASFLSVYVALQALAGPGPVQLTWRSWMGALSLVLMLLLMRVYDELKDVEADLRLAAAGDPGYVNRPIVTGEVQVKDITRLRLIVTLAVWAVNVPLGFPNPLLAFAIAFLFAWLSSKWFFWPKIQTSLLLAFATHNPITLLFLGYIAAVFVADFPQAELTLLAVPLLVAMWLPVAAWETSRKIRIPEDETDYETYSRTLGVKVAPLLPMFATGISAALLVPTLRTAGISWWFVGLLLGVAGVMVLRCLQFLIAPTRERANLRPLAEAYGLVVNVGIVIAVCVGRGVASWF